MTIKNDRWINEQAANGMIVPYVERSVREHEGHKVLSYGTSSYGYDVRCSDDYRIFTNVSGCILDAKDLDINSFVHRSGPSIIIPPNSFALTHTVEYFKIPRDVLVICVGKSSLARIGAVINVTPIEPEFEGHVVIEISNTTTLPMRIHSGEGIAQFLFFQSDEPCTTSYKDRGGKYQGQTGITLPLA